MTSRSTSKGRESDHPRDTTRSGPLLTEQRVRKMYQSLERVSGKAELNLLGIENGYLNYGYWAPGCTDHDEACTALAERLGEAAGISAGDRVLDVGFGFGEQDFLWARTRM